MDIPEEKMTSSPESRPKNISLMNILEENLATSAPLRLGWEDGGWEDTPSQIDTSILRSPGPQLRQESPLLEPESNLNFLLELSTIDTWLLNGPNLQERLLVPSGGPTGDFFQIGDDFQIRAHFYDETSTMQGKDQCFGIDFQRRHPCEACEKTFTSRRDLNRHSNSIHKHVIQHRCACSKSFTRRHNLLRHIRISHNSECASLGVGITTTPYKAVLPVLPTSSIEIMGGDGGTEQESKHARTNAALPAETTTSDAPALSESDDQYIALDDGNGYDSDNSSREDSALYSIETIDWARRPLALQNSPLPSIEAYNDFADDSIYSLSRSRLSTPESPYFTMLTPASSRDTPTRRGNTTSPSPVDSDMISIPGEPGTLESPESNNSMQAVLSETLARILKEFRAVKRGGPERSTPQQQSPSFSTQGFSSAYDGHSALSHKRATMHDEGEEYTSEGQPAASVEKKPKQEDCRKRSLACPYWKRDKAMHSTCGKFFLTRIRDVKQHLHRRHYREFYCPRCLVTFEEEQSFRHHIMGDTPCRPSPGCLESMSHSQRNALNKKSNPKHTIEGQWFSIWDILFPGNPRPDSPFADPELSEDFYDFQEFSRQRGPVILEEILNANMIWSMPENDQHLRLPDILGQGLDAISGDWIMSLPLSPRLHPTASTSLPGRTGITSSAAPSTETQNTTPMFGVSTVPMTGNTSHQVEEEREQAPELQSVREDFYGTYLNEELFQDDELAMAFNQLAEEEDSLQ